jgi:hypothetical protein
MAVEILWNANTDVATVMDAIDLRGDELTTLVRATLGRLQDDPYSNRLGTRQFQSPAFGHLRVTPCRYDDWNILWHPGEGDTNIVIVYIARLSF